MKLLVVLGDITPLIPVNYGRIYPPTAAHGMCTPSILPRQ